MPRKQRVADHDLSDRSKMPHFVYGIQKPQSAFSALQGLGIGSGDVGEGLEFVDSEVNHPQDNLRKVGSQDFLSCPERSAFIVFL